ncbi:sigma factor-like helix-turn-helix DNA-binding protein [Sphingomonas psychrotolerans]|uniref:RNA polymerase sigma factor 70 region 4 type 2 domain-containing protein n=1 Tax=Sphingomonas psychrotolerans TaxID=1327635 RepID=A0A2K8MGH1_9SPHN|nr:sigma factor-like helix-turn-helix DNA-binding protein [Sphingomonas psychrotolerans]ATY32967.1 hypothetical protein CVN68_14175 [Sphingomonas psychrotolerans]
MIRWVEMRRMRRVFRALSERDRAIFGSVRFDDLSYAEAAERHGCSVEEVEGSVANVLLALSGRSGK